MNELETLRKLLAAAMAAEQYDKARQYMYLIESIEDAGEEDTPEMED